MPRSQPQLRKRPQQNPAAPALLPPIDHQCRLQPLQRARLCDNPGGSEGEGLDLEAGSIFRRPSRLLHRGWEVEELIASAVAQPAGVGEVGPAGEATGGHDLEQVCAHFAERPAAAIGKRGATKSPARIIEIPGLVQVVEARMPAAGEDIERPDQHLHYAAKSALAFASALTYVRFPNRADHVPLAGQRVRPIIDNHGVLLRERHPIGKVTDGDRGLALGNRDWVGAVQGRQVLAAVAANIKGFGSLGVLGCKAFVGEADREMHQGALGSDLRPDRQPRGIEFRFRAGCNGRGQVFGLVKKEREEEEEEEEEGEEGSGEEERRIMIRVISLMVRLWVLRQVSDTGCACFGRQPTDSANLIESEDEIKEREEEGGRKKRRRR